MNKRINLPKTATIAGRNIRLSWEVLDTMDGWYAQVSPRRVREFERDKSLSMDSVEQDLRQFCDYTHYGQDRSGNTYLRAYIRA